MVGWVGTTNQNVRGGDIGWTSIWGPFLESRGIVNRSRKAVFVCRLYFQYLGINGFEIHTTLKKIRKRKKMD